MHIPRRKRANAASGLTILLQMLEITAFPRLAEPEASVRTDLSCAVDLSRSDSGPGTEGQALPRVYLLPVTFLPCWLSCWHGWA